MTIAPVGTPSVEADLGFTGHLLFPGDHGHGGEGLWLAFYRAYDPALGRWLSADPIEFVTGHFPELLHEGPNPYQYVGGNALNYVDSDGLEIEVKESNGPTNPRRDTKTGRYASKDALAKQIQNAPAASPACPGQKP